MIAIDSKVLLRYLLADDEGQYQKAERIITSLAPVLLTDVVLAETVWTLIGKRYGLDKSTIIKVIRSLFTDDYFVFEDPQVVWLSFNDYKNSQSVSGKPVDFADALIANKSVAIARDGNSIITK